MGKKKRRFKKETTYDWESFSLIGKTLVIILCVIFPYFATWYFLQQEMFFIHCFLAIVMLVVLLVVKFTSKTEYIEK